MTTLSTGSFTAGPDHPPAPRGQGTLVCLAGPPGAGKSTLAAAAARELGLVVVDLDSVTTELVHACARALGAPLDLEHPTLASLRSARYACLAAVVRDNLAAGHDVVAVAPFTSEATSRERYAAWLASAAAAPPPAADPVAAPPPAADPVAADPVAAHPAAADPVAAHPPARAPLLVWLDIDPGSARARRARRASTRDAARTDVPHAVPTVADVVLDATGAPGAVLAALTSAVRQPVQSVQPIHQPVRPVQPVQPVRQTAQSTTPPPRGGLPAMSDPTTARPWRESEAHRQWLRERLARLVDFMAPGIVPAGGFAYPDADGSAMPGHTPLLFLCARTTHVSALAHALGIPGSGRLLDHGVRSLLGPFRDADGGWDATAGAGGRKETYAQVHVALAASSALAAGHPQARELLDAVCEVIDTRLWEEEPGMLAESFDRGWGGSEAYRGANANMHGVEAFIAVGDVTGDARWHERALRMADRVVNRGARELGWLVPEHFDTEWHALPEHNRDDPHHQFRPYGATPGHALEWARFLCHLHTSPHLPGTPWLLEAAAALTDRAMATWGADGREGLPYTVDWDGTPVSTVRLHWPVCEGIQSSAVLGQLTGEPRFEDHYRRLWDHAATWFAEPTGTWKNELDEHLAEAGTVWPGRPDVYHIAGAYAVPLLPVGPFLTLAAAQSRT